MSKPIWDSAGSNKALADTGYATMIGSPDPRVMTHGIPGVNGVAVGLFGTGPRYITGSGYLDGAANATVLTAIANVKSDLGDLQALCGASVATYTDTDGATYAYCVLLSVEPAGPAVPHIEGVTGYVARIPVRFVILQQEAS